MINFKCELCGKEYKTGYGLKNHSYLHCPHPESVNKRYPEPDRQEEKPPSLIAGCRYDVKPKNTGK